MATDKLPQKRRFIDAEFATLKQTFADNEELLKAIRKVMLQVELSKEEKKMITNTFNNEAVFNVVSKTFLPQIDTDAPLGQVVDLWLTLDLKGMSPNEAWDMMLVRDKLINYIKQQLELLKGGALVDGIFFNNLEFSEDKDVDDAFIDQLTRQQIIQHVEQQLFQLQTLAGVKTETVEETLARINKDSSK